MLLTIEKLIYGGDGLARLPANAGAEWSGVENSHPTKITDRPPEIAHSRGKAVFVPFVLAGEKVEAHITEQKAGFARASVDAVVGPSPVRGQPPCPYFSRCGGCHYQHASYEHQLEIKQDILRETLRRVAKLELQCEIEVHPSPPWNYRNRSRLQLRTQPGFVLGYHKTSSHEAIAVEECPISSALINRGIAQAWAIGRAGKVPEGVREIEFFANGEDAQMLVEVACTAEARRGPVRGFAEELRAAVPEIVGVVGMRENPHASRKGQPRHRTQGIGLLEPLVSLGERHLLYRTQRASYRVSAGSFFQTNRHLIDPLLDIVAGGRSGESALDLYAGVGLFSTALASDVRHIVSVESSQTSAEDLAYNQPGNVTTVQATTEQYLARLDNPRSGKGAVLPHPSYQPNLAVADPPRSGLGEPVARLLAKLGTPQVIYVSCDPATLARDLVILSAAGYEVARAHLIDMFPQTYHIESVMELRKSGA